MTDTTAKKPTPEPKPKKGGFWSKLGKSIGNAIGEAKFGGR